MGRLFCRPAAYKYQPARLSERPGGSAPERRNSSPAKPHPTDQPMADTSDVADQPHLSNTPATIETNFISFAFWIIRTHVLNWANATILPDTVNQRSTGSP